MVAPSKSNNSSQIGKSTHLINGSNSSLPKPSTPKVNFQRQNDDDSFSLDTIPQMNISNVELEVCERYLLNQLRHSAPLLEREKCKLLLEKKLRKFGFIEQADRLKRCCADFTALVCENGHSFRARPYFICKLPFCPNCWVIKSRQALRQTLPKILQALKDDPSLIVAFNTLTIKSDNERSYLNGCRKIKADFKKLRRQDVWKNCVGGVGQVENTFSKRYRWHPHCHSILLLKNYIPQKALSDSWNDVTGDSMIVDIRTVDDLAKGLIEVIKYPFKPADLNKLGKREIKEMLAAKGQRLRFPFGVLFGLEIDDDLDEETTAEYAAFIEETKSLEIGDPCPICQTKLDLIDFTAEGYAKFLGVIRVTARGSP
jgi:hypothetical protein